MSSQSSNTESLSISSLAGDYTGSQEGYFSYGAGGAGGINQLRGAPFLAWSLRDIRATPDAIPAAAGRRDRLRGLNFCSALTGVQHLSLRGFSSGEHSAQQVSP